MAKHGRQPLLSPELSHDMQTMEACTVLLRRFKAPQDRFLRVVLSFRSDVHRMYNVDMQEPMTVVQAQVIHDNVMKEQDAPYSNPNLEPAEISY